MSHKSDCVHSVMESLLCLHVMLHCVHNVMVMVMLCLRAMFHC